MQSVALLAGTSAWADPTVVLVHETGPAYILQNDGRYGDPGTDYDAGDVGQQDTLVRVQRTSAELGVGRHTVILLVAPLALTTRATLADDLQFRSTRFPAGTVVDHLYRFDGYRASWLYRVLPRPVRLDLGGSLQIRSADVAFTSVGGQLHDGQSDIGLVPAAKLRARVPAEAGPFAELELDGSSTFGLVGDTSGALYDVAASGGLPIGDGFDLLLTARLLGGGADVPDQAIYNWANFLSLSVAVRLHLDELLPRARRAGPPPPG